MLGKKSGASQFIFYPPHFFACPYFKYSIDSLSHGACASMTRSLTRRSVFNVPIRRDFEHVENVLHEKITASPRRVGHMAWLNRKASFRRSDCRDRAAGVELTDSRAVLLSAVRATIAPIRVTGVLASSGNGGRMAFVGESSRPGTGRRMLAMPISGDFGASRHSDIKDVRRVEFESIHLLAVELSCRSNCHQKVGVPLRRKDS